LITEMEDETRSMEFHEVDNLDSKTIEQAEDSYEKTFVTIRNILESNEQYCCDDEVDRLSMAQALTDALKTNKLIRKG